GSNATSDRAGASSRVSARMFGEPVPRGTNDRLGILVLCFPAEDFFGAAGIGVKRDRIAGAAGAIGDRDRFAGDLFRGSDDFLDRESVPGAEIAEDRLAGGQALHRG